jgi:hypothetical protein
VELRVHFSCLKEVIVRINCALRSRWSCFLLIVNMLVAGCGLTKSEVSAVQDFAKASTNYPAAPASVITAYYNVYQTRAAFDVSTKPSLTGVLKSIDVVATAVPSGQKSAKQMTAALQIISKYGDLLTKLSSTDFTEADDKSAQALGKSIDSDATEFKKETGIDVPSSIGTAVADAVKGLGGLYISYRQAEELKAAVNTGQGLIEKLAADINSKLPDIESDVEAENSQLRQALCVREAQSAQIEQYRAKQVVAMIETSSESGRRRGNHSSQLSLLCKPIIRLDDKGNFQSCDDSGCVFEVSPETAATLIDARLKISNTEQLIESIQKATNQLLAAHTALNNSLNRGESLSKAIEQIQYFIQAVKGANAEAKSTDQPKSTDDTKSINQ